MLCTSEFLTHLVKRELGPYVGVPCSFLKPFINYVIDHSPRNYISANNEGEAIAIATGAYLAGRCPVVMFQNSGLGNTVNPLTSLNHVFKIPVLLIITWRGEPGTKDEPQHRLMGQITRSMLDLMQINNDLFPEDDAEVESKIDAALSYMKMSGLPYAFILRKAAMTNYELSEQKRNDLSLTCAGRHLWAEPKMVRPMLRKDAVTMIADAVGPDTLIVATTGKTARELAEYRDRPTNFYVVGSMGCASSLGLGIAMHRLERQLVVLDGDGAALMRLEAMVSIGHYRPKNFIHVLLDNESYESTGGQRTLSQSVNFPEIAIACGYRTAASASTAQALDNLLNRARATEGPHLIHLRIQPGSDPNLARPTLLPSQIAMRFRQAVCGHD